MQDELEARADEAATWRNQQVQRAREEADLARVRYMRTDPNHRMVADVLEAEWNAKLRALDQAQREIERRCADENPTLAQHQRDRIVALEEIAKQLGISTTTVKLFGTGHPALRITKPDRRWRE